MTRISKLFFLLATTVSLIAIAAVVPNLPHAFAATGLAYSPLPPGQGYGGQGQGIRITCSSNDGRRKFCAADTRGNVRLVRQISGSPCIQGRTWGYDRQGLWVDQGCRADFVISRGGPPPPPPPPFQVITCSSNDGRRNYCPVNRRNDVRMSRQISGSPCVRGQTWDVDRHGIWVDRGCRAEFRVY